MTFSSEQHAYKQRVVNEATDLLETFCWEFRLAKVWEKGQIINQYTWLWKFSTPSAHNTGMAC
jgi:hypothetical protein